MTREHLRRHRNFLERRCSIEPLEGRSLLALTVIAHGLAELPLLRFPEWVYDMGAAVTARAGKFDATDLNGDDIPDMIQNAVVDTDGVHPSVGSRTIAPDLMLLDWSEKSDTPGAANEDAVAGAFAESVGYKLGAKTGTTDIHFIGHSRGAYVVMEIARRLGSGPLKNRIGFVHMTTLDPHAYGTDGALEKNPGGIVDYSDNYYQDAGGLTGKPIAGARNTDLTAVLDAWSGREVLGNAWLGNHSEVHDWYHWTIDTSDNGSPALVDEDLPTLNSSLRAQLYGSFGATFAGDDATVAAEEGAAKAGYYFSLAGGGIGRLVHNEQGDLFTVDVRDGTTPLYLGNIAERPFFRITDIAYSPTGELYAIESVGNLLKIETEFDSDNTPTPKVTVVGPLLYFVNALTFLPDGRLFAIGGDILLEVNPATATWSDVFVLPPGYGSSGDLEVDHNGNLYLATTTLEGKGVLFRIAADLTEGEALYDLPAPDFFGLAMSGGMLYGFCNTTDRYSINLGTGEVRYLGELTGGLQGGIAGATSTSALALPVWQNPVNRLDVNDDTRVTTRDVLIIINTLLALGSRLIAGPDLLSFYYDVSGDGMITPRDVLMVINYLLSQGSQEDLPEASAQVYDSEQRQLAVAAAMTLYADTEAEDGPLALSLW